MEKKKINKTALKYGSISMAVTAVVIAVVIVFNLVLAELPAKWVKIDTSENAVVSFTDETKDYLAGVNEKIEIFVIAETGYEDARISQLLDYYKDENSNITVKYIDPVKNPTFVSEYTEEELYPNSLIVKSDKRHQVVNGSLLYIHVTYDIIYGTGQIMEFNDAEWKEYFVKNDLINKYYQDTGYVLPVTEYFFGESLVTSAIDYVIMDSLPVMYVMTGHGETAMGSYYSSIFESINVTAKDVNIITGDEVKVPEDADVIYINAPSKDIFEKELDALKAYIDNGGVIVLTTSIETFDPEKMPNLSKLTEYMGMKGNPQLVAEGDTTHYIQGDPYAIYPVIGTEGIVASNPSNYNFTYLVLSSHGIEIMDNTTNKVSSVFTTTEQAKYDKDDKTGIINLAAQSVNENGGALYWFANPNMFLDRLLEYCYNSRVLTQVAVTHCSVGAPVDVALKPLTSGTTLAVTEADEVLWSSMFLVVIPVGTLIAGFVVWFTRRRR